jgi:dienelactone hydrolase
MALACLLTMLLSAACGGGDGSATDDDASGVRERAVRFSTSDKVELTGRLFGNGRVGVVLAHMYPADAESWYGPAKKFAAAGYMALAFNFRGYADSEGEKSPSKAAIDVRAASAELMDRGAKDVALVGASMGGTAALVAADDSTPLAVVAISAPARFMTLDAIAVSQNVQRPVLLMAARENDTDFRALQELERALPNPDTKLYNGDAHGTNLLSDRPEAVAEIVSFLQRYAPTNGSTSTQGPADE